MNTQKLPAILMSVLATTVLLAVPWASADEYPTRSISLVVGFSPGGGVDTAARLISPKLRDVLGQPIVIDYRPGAGGAIAAGYVAKRAPPDGYTLSLCTFSDTVLYPSLIKKNVDYAQKDLLPVTTFAKIAISINVRADSKWKTLDDFVKDAKKNPGKYSYSSYGALSLAQLVMELFSEKAGIKLIHVPFAGSPLANTALLGGHVDISATTGTGGLYKAGKLRILAVASDERFLPYEKAPIFTELGYPGIVTKAMMGICVPSRTPKAIVQTLDNAMAQVFAKHGKDLLEAFTLIEQEAIYSPHDKAMAEQTASTEVLKPIIGKLE